MARLDYFSNLGQGWKRLKNKREPWAQKQNIHNLYNLFLFVFLFVCWNFIYYLRTFCFTTSYKLYVITAPAVDLSLIPACMRNPTHERLHKYCAGSSASSPEKKKKKVDFCIRGKPF